MRKVLGKGMWRRPEDIAPAWRFSVGVGGERGLPKARVFVFEVVFTCSDKARLGRRGGRSESVTDDSSECPVVCLSRKR